MRDLSKSLNTNFSVVCNALPNVELFVTDAPVPDADSINATAHSRFGISIPLHGDVVEYQPLVLGFIIDEYWHSYEEIYRHIFAQNNYINVDRSEIRTFPIYVDILDNAKRPMLRFEFVDAFPISLGGIQLDHQGDGSVNVASATFRYSYFLLKRLTETTPPAERRIPLPLV